MESTATGVAAGRDTLEKIVKLKSTNVLPNPVPMEVIALTLWQDTSATVPVATTDPAVNQMSTNVVTNLAKTVERAKMDLTNTFASAGLATKADNVREK